MHTKASLKGREPSYEVIEGVECALVPLGKEGKHGTFTCEKADWDSYLFRGYSPNLTVNSSGVVITTHRGSRAGRSNNVTFASLIMPARKGHRIHYRNGDRRDLRRSNLSYRKGRGRTYQSRTNVPDPRIRAGIKVFADNIPDLAEANRRKEIMRGDNTQPWELPLEDDLSGVGTLEELLELPEFRKYKDHV